MSTRARYQTALGNYMTRLSANQRYLDFACVIMFKFLNIQVMLAGCCERYYEKYRVKKLSK